MKINAKKKDWESLANQMGYHYFYWTTLPEIFRKLFPSYEKLIRNRFSLIKEKKDAEHQEVRVPDICIYNKVTEERQHSYTLHLPSVPLVTIEADDWKSGSNTRERASFVYRVSPTVKEVFSCRYDKKCFMKYGKDDCSTPEKSGFCETLGFDLNKLFECDEQYFTKINEIKTNILFSLFLNTPEFRSNICMDFHIQGDENILYYLPRITIFKDKEGKSDPLLTIEIVDKDTKELTSRIIKKYQAANPSIKESWLYNMGSRTWKGINSEGMMKDSLSKLLNLDMDVLLKKDK